MAKPSIAELLNASGYTTYTAELVQRAMFTLYGNVGANQDGRNWAAILGIIGDRPRFIGGKLRHR